LTLFSINRPVTWFIAIPLSCTTFIPSMEIRFQINLFLELCELLIGKSFFCIMDAFTVVAAKSDQVLGWHSVSMLVILLRNLNSSMVYMQGSEGGNTVSLIDDHLYHLMCGCCSLCQVYNSVLPYFSSSDRKQLCVQFSTWMVWIWVSLVPDDVLRCWNSSVCSVAMNGLLQVCRWQALRQWPIQTGLVLKLYHVLLPDPSWSFSIRNSPWLHIGVCRKQGH
jgi:hypothetical protein